MLEYTRQVNSYNLGCFLFVHPALSSPSSFCKFHTAWAENILRAEGVSEMRREWSEGEKLPHRHTKDCCFANVGSEKICLETTKKSQN